MKSAGYSHKSKGLPEDSTGENTKIYPSFTVPHHAMPHMKDHKVGDTGQMTIKYKVTSQHAYKSGEGDTSAEITHYEPAKRVKGKTDKEMIDEQDKDESNQPKAEQK